MSFKRPEAVGKFADLSADRSEELATTEGTIGGSSLVYNRRSDASVSDRYLSADDQRSRLPVNKFRDHIEYLLSKHQTLVIVAETGSGKSTQLPQIVSKLCHQWTDGETDNKQPMVAVTEPRRVAAVTLAARVAEEMGVQLGREVGYCIGFEDFTAGPAITRVKFCTEAILVNELMSDPLLTAYGAVIVDEAHERTLHTDILLALLKKISRKRPTLRLIIASATIDCELMRQYFDHNPNPA
ncbi:unnamed protein product, partial [Medioppia subpectinata]